MKTTQRLKKALGCDILEAAYIVEGLTNDNYAVKTEKGDFVVRLPKKGNDLLFDYPLEGRILNLIKPVDLDVPCVSFDTQTGVKVSRTIPNAQTFTHPHIADAAHLIRTLHRLKIHTGKRFDIRQRYQQYHQAIDSPLFDTSPYAHYIDDAYHMSSDWILCHNDLVPGNFLFTDHKHYLIDYEYAMDNDPYFDIMSFLTENDITNPLDRKRFYSIYFGKQPDAVMMEKLNVFERAHHVLWCEWAQMMYQKYRDTVYYDIASLKYQRLLELHA